MAVAVEGREIDIFYGCRKYSARALSAPALGLSDPQPIGRAVTGAAEAAAVDKGFQEFDGMPVFTLPIRRDPGDDPPEYMTGQLRNMNPGKVEETGVVDDPSQGAGPLGGAPPNPITIRSRRGDF